MPAASVQTVLHDELGQRLKDLVVKARQRFLGLPGFPSSTWEDHHWVYQDKVRIYLGCSESTEQLETLNKVFVVTCLWNSRGRKKPLSATRVKNLAAATKLLSKAGVTGLGMIDQEAYERTVNGLRVTYARAETVCNDLNLLMAYLKEQRLLLQPIHTIRGAVHFQQTDQHGRVALDNKLPLPELVRAIIELKWAIEAQADHSVRAQIDTLAVLTQAFQFGLGLRIGEVLRLPKDCLVELNGQVFCNVWTEKGSAPVARYVPTLWRPVLCDALSRINAICEPWRKQAAHIENGAVAAGLDQRFEGRVQAIDAELSAALDRLRDLSQRNTEIAQGRLRLLKPVADEDWIELKRLREYLPFASTATDAQSLIKFYTRSGFLLTSQSTGRLKHRHFVVGRDLKRRVTELIEFRKNSMTYEELFCLIHGRAPVSRQVKSAHLQGVFQSRILSALEWFVVTGQKASSGTPLVYFTYEAATKAITHMVGGGYDYRRCLPLKDAEQLYPELFTQKTMTLINNESHGGFFSYLKIGAERSTFFRKTVSSRGLSYTSGSGYLLEYNSIQHAITQSFAVLNTKLQSELTQEIKNNVMARGLAITSTAFDVHQKVSEHLFVVPSSLGGVYNASIPSILSYHAVLYSIKPGGRGQDGRSAFSRYGVKVSDEVINSFHTHQGRHWQTNSLFRAGLAASIVNKWMGRTDTQGAHYDHRTARERALKVGELMLEEQSRFIGALPEQVRQWQQREIPIQMLQTQLSSALQTAHYSPLGFCVRDINLKPCEYHLKCLTGNAGLGCREFVFDLHDPVQRRNIEAERDKAEQELARLFEVLNRDDIPVESVEMHVEHQMAIYRNASAILERSELILTNAQAQHMRDFQPFRRQGSKPDDCVFQCGE
jgi:hypothetical protein